MQVTEVLRAWGSMTSSERERAISDMIALRRCYSKIDMLEGLIREFASPPSSPAECTFAQTTHTISADLKTQIVPCQFGGDPDCSQCGCVASMGLAAIGNYRLAGVLPVRRIFWTSIRVGQVVASRAAQNGSDLCSRP